MYRLLLLGLLLCMEKSFSSVVVLFLYGLKLCATEGYCWSNVFFFTKKTKKNVDRGPASRICYLVYFSICLFLYVFIYV